MPEPDQLTSTPDRGHSRARGSRAFATGAVCLALAGGLFACGSDSNSDTGSTGTTASTTAGADAASGGVEEARAQIEQYSGVPEFTLEAEPFDIAAAKGMTVFNLPATSENPFVTAMDTVTRDLAKEHGIEWVEYANQGQPNQWVAGINEAITQKVDLIMMDGVNVELVAEPLKRAKEAGIKTLMVHSFDLDAELPAEVEELIDAQVRAPHALSARLEADYAIADSDGEANVLIVTSAETPPAKGIVAAMESEFEERCADCSTKVVNIRLADWATKMTSEVQAALQADPGINYILPIYDSMSLFIEPAVKSTGSDAKIVSYNGSPAILKMIQDGDIMAMDVGEPAVWLGWAHFDQIGRMLTDTPTVPDGNAQTPVRVFTDENIAETGTPPALDKGYGDAYKAGYEALWGGGQ